jgi:hypothetical protein
MKTSFRLMQIAFIVLAGFGLFSCKKTDSGLGKANFSLSIPSGSGQLKSGTIADSGIVSYQLLISIEDMKGNPVFSDKLIPLYTFGTGFVSENVEIKAGEYNLTRLMVINPSGVVIYAAPLTGSPLAYLISRPLPLNFVISPDKVTTLTQEVLPVENQSPGQFGYASFSVQIINPLVVYTICILDNPLLMAPTQITTAELTIFADSGWHYSFKLEAMVNRIVIRGGSEKYIFLLEKEGYASQNFEFTASQLMATSQTNPLVLKIPWGPGQVLTLQPGPEAGKDAMISNLEPDRNFGNYQYFEATFLSEPVLTVMRLNRSLIWFDLSQLPVSASIQKVILKLSYDLPIPWDSTVIIPGTPGDISSFVGGVLQQVIEPWEENKVTWNNQPASIESNQVFIPPFNINANSIEVDITKLIVPATANPLPNWGMKFKLLPEDKFPGFRFASSDYPVSSMRPMLMVYYTTVK